MAKPGLNGIHQTIAAILRRQAAQGEPCHLCDKPIDTRSPTEGGPAYRSRWSFSVDHIVPRSKGGRSTLANSLPAHYGCNSGRGNRPVPRARPATPPAPTWRPRSW